MSEPSEAMRAKCEAIARAVANDGGVDESEYRTAIRIADAIAALRAPERPAEQILEERFPYLKDSRS